MTQPIQLLLLIPHLGGGGAERVTFLLAERLDPRRFDIHLASMTADFPGAEPPPESVVVHRLGAKRVRGAWLKLLRLIWSVRPDAILSNMAHLNFLVLALKPLLPSKSRILVRQNTTVSSSSDSRISQLGYRWFYPRADAILCQSQAMAEDLAHYYRLPNKKLTVLSNPIDLAAVREASTTNQPDIQWATGSWPRLIAVGRLAPEKGFDLLLHAFSAILPTYPQAQLAILGEGRELAALRTLTHELKVSESVTLPGFTSMPSAWFAHATLFVLSSRLEGMPNALLEAAAAGLPLISTPCCAGVVSLLHRAPGTWLASETSSAALAQTILRALESFAGPANPPRRFDHTFLAPFDSATAIAAYESLIERVAMTGKP